MIDEAHRLTSVDRQGEYGHPLDHFGRTAAALSLRFRSGPDPLFRRDMTPEEWALAMVLDKIMRGEDPRSKGRDDHVDVIGYTRAGEMVTEERQRRKGNGKPGNGKAKACPCGSPCAVEVPLAAHPTS